MKQLLRQLRILLRYDRLYHLILLLTFIYVLTYSFYNIIPTKYNENNRILYGYIQSINWDGNHLKLIVKGKEKVLVNYYVENYQEYVNIKNNYKVGDYLKLKGLFFKPERNRNFNLFNYQKYLLSKNVYWTFTTDQIIQHTSHNNLLFKIKNKINIHLKNNYIKLFVLGDSTNLADNTYNTYKVNGILHLFSISGMHIAILSSISLFVLKKVIKRTLISYSIVICFIAFYIFLVNFSISAIKAALYFVLVFINRTLNLHVKPYNLLILILCLFLLINPYIYYNVGFQYSFIVSFYLHIFKSIFSYHKNYIIKIFYISLIAFLVSIPILINNNFSINLLSVFNNLIFVPFISIIVFPMAILSAFIPQINGLFNFIIDIMETLSMIMAYIKIEIVMAKMPLYVTILYYIFITYILYGLKRRRYYPFLLFFLLIIIHHNIAKFNKYPTITMLDVGQGDSILITLPFNQSNILVDTGGKLSYNNDWKKAKPYSIAVNTIIPYLKSVGINKLDYLVLTHGDYDHIGETTNLINNFKVNNVIMNKGNTNKIESQIKSLISDKHIKYMELDNYMLDIGNYKFLFINNKNTKDENKDSLVILSKLNNKNILLMGDADYSVEENILSKYNMPIIDVIKVGLMVQNIAAANHL